MEAPYDNDPAGTGARAARVAVVEAGDATHAGQAVYTASTLRAYDLLIVHLSNTLVWRCPARRMIEQYDRHVSASHLDVGPATGFYLDRCRFPDDEPGLTLLDANPEVLAYAGRRLARYRPRTFAADVLRPIALPLAEFGSVGLGFVLHCLPGDVGSKAVLFDHLAPLVVPGGVVFGSTILHEGVDHTRLARRLLPVYNRKGIFSNRHDRLDDLERALAERFARYELEVQGGVALFAGWLPDAPPAAAGGTGSGAGGAGPGHR